MNGKWCCRCRQRLSPDAFRPNSNYTSGLDSWCRGCHAEAVRDWRPKNPDYVERYNAERRAEYRTQHPLPTRPCVVCGRPVTKRPDALVCGEPFSGRPNALVCGPECRRQRKLVQRRLLRLISKT